MLVLLYFTAQHVSAPYESPDASPIHLSRATNPTKCGQQPINNEFQMLANPPSLLKVVAWQYDGTAIQEGKTLFFTPSLEMEQSVSDGH